MLAAPASRRIPAVWHENAGEHAWEAPTPSSRSRKPWGDRRGRAGGLPRDIRAAEPSPANRHSPQERKENARASRRDSNARRSLAKRRISRSHRPWPPSLPGPLLKDHEGTRERRPPNRTESWTAVS